MANEKKQVNSKIEETKRLTQNAKEDKRLRARREMRDRLLIGGICWLVGFAALVALYFVSKQTDFRAFFYEDVTSDTKVYVCAGLALACLALLGIPFLRLPPIGRVFSFLWGKLTGNSNLLSNVAKDDADYYVTDSNSYEYKGKYYVNYKYKGKWEIIFETILTILGLIVGTVALYAIGLAVSPLVLLGEGIYMVATK